MSLVFEQTALWRRSLGPRPGDEHQYAREHLRTALLTMRSNAAHLVKFIPKDCEGLTVHDVTHLDALWEMADMIAGDEFDLNPVEAFVFGAAVLIHDAGMSIASYPGGMSDITKTTEWQDIAAATYRHAGVRKITAELVEAPREEYRQEIIFSVLRAFHAKHAANLVSTKWLLPDTKDEVRLLEDLEFRTAFGQSKGRIAHSHHWGIERVATELRGRTGTAAGLPNTWTLHEIKVACLLRCADAAHIDHRRAPSMLYALTSPKGISREHWNFQHKLKKPTRTSEMLVYSGASDFDISEAPSWWLCYDTIKMIDHELSTSHALLQDIGENPFTVRRVFGAESPRILARQIGCAGWYPVDAEIRVSDPVNLAQKLGGRNLYGRGVLAPIRELIQNATDAVRARRSLEGRDGFCGKIRLIFEGVAGEIWVHVDDTGIGMSERILVGPLLDFGKSLWNSAMLREEFPGLEAHGINPIGKFGIGFFSIFCLGKSVTVVSKKFDGGAGDVRVLEFSSITSRPIIRPSRPGELPTDYSTRVSVKLDDRSVLNQEAYDNDIYGLPSGRDLLENIKLLIVALDIECEIIDRTGMKHVHSPDWTKMAPEDFLNIIVTDPSRHGRHYPYGRVGKSTTIAAHIHLIDNLVDQHNNIYGRGAISMFETRSQRYVSIGGLVSEFMSLASFEIPYIGVIRGETDEISRRSAALDVPASVIAAWASRQANLIDRAHFRTPELMQAAYNIVRAGGDPGSLPFCLSGRNFLSFENFRRRISEFGSVDLPVRHDYENTFSLHGLDTLNPDHLLSENDANVVVVLTERESLLANPEMMGRRILDDGEADLSEDDVRVEGPFELLRDICREIWGCMPKMKVTTRTIVLNDYFLKQRASWVLSFIRT